MLYIVSFNLCEKTHTEIIYILESIFFYYNSNYKIKERTQIDIFY